MMFRAQDTKDAILLYTAQGRDGYGDFISIAVKDKHVEFRFDSGSGWLSSSLGFLVNEVICLILVIQTFSPSALSVLYNKDVYPTSSIV